LRGSKLLYKNYYKCPLILAENITIYSINKDKFETLSSFLSDTFNMSINIDAAQYTKKYCTTVDAVF